MARYLIAVSLLGALLLAIFVVVGEITPGFAAPDFRPSGGYAIGPAVGGVGLLVADVVLPVPSSLVMIANGAIFGIALGTTFSMAGLLGGGFAGFFLGRRGTNLFARFVSAADRERANRLIERWGMLALVVTRPLPILAEVTVITAGASSMKWTQMILAVAVGSLPVALIYAVAGATAKGFDDLGLALLLTLLAATGFWAADRWLRRR